MDRCNINTNLQCRPASPSWLGCGAAIFGSAGWKPALQLVQRRMAAAVLLSKFGRMRPKPRWKHRTCVEGSRDGQLFWFESAKFGNAECGNGWSGNDEFGDGARRLVESGVVWDWRGCFCGAAGVPFRDIWLSQRSARLLFESAAGRRCDESGAVAPIVRAARPEADGPKGLGAPPAADTPSYSGETLRRDCPSRYRSGLAAGGQLSGASLTPKMPS
jgi:hypothetical protein